ncbi:S66 peptidase family protein [Viscerimonas tarda]
MVQYLIPQPLKEGDKAVIVSPSGNIDSLYIDKAKSVLEEWGLRVEVAAYARGHNGRFAGTVEQRLADIQTAMDDAGNRLIFCSRGGYGVVHLLEGLDFRKLKASPKWLVGYSDITALHQAFLCHGMASLHAPMCRHLSENEGDKSSMYLKEILFGQIPRYVVESHPLNLEGVADGTLFGGNLAVFCSLLSTNQLTIPSDGILFIEDIGERAYQIDRMMWTLKLSGIFDRIKGLVVGSFTDCAEDPLMYRPVYESIRSVVEKRPIPVAFGFPVGHTKDNYPMLHGGSTKLVVTDNKVELILNSQFSIA